MAKVDIFSGFRLAVMRKTVWQMGIIMILMDDVDGFGTVDELPALHPGFVKHPVIVSSSSQGSSDTAMPRNETVIGPI